MKKVFVLWLFTAVILASLCVLAYAGVQQVYRQSANDPQIEATEGLVKALNMGSDPTAFFGAGTTVNPATDLTIWAVVYDDKGKALGTNASLDNKPISLPSGAPEYLKNHGREIVTIEPKPGVRQAAVIMPYKSSKTSGYLMVGKSLREIEKRERGFMYLAGAVLLFTWILSFVAIWLSQAPSKTPDEKPQQV